jgi:hypothetical protein
MGVVDLQTPCSWFIICDSVKAGFELAWERHQRRADCSQDGGIKDLEPADRPHDCLLIGSRIVPSREGIAQL